MKKYSYWGGSNPPPENLKTERQVNDLGFSAKKPVAFIETKKYTISLYDISNGESVQPKKVLTEAQKAGVEKSKIKKEWKYWLKTNKNALCAQYSAIQIAKQILENESHFLILDTETTGLNGEVIEIAIIDLAGNALLNQRVKPQSMIEEEAKYIHGISDEDLANEPNFDEITPKIKELAINKTILIYNESFDVRIIANSTKAKIELKTYCIMNLYSRFVHEWSSHWKSYRWQRLPAGDHTALGDCLATLKIIKEMANTEINFLASVPAEVQKETLDLFQSIFTRTPSLAEGLGKIDFFTL